MSSRKISTEAPKTIFLEVDVDSEFEEGCPITVQMNRANEKGEHKPVIYAHPNTRWEYKNMLEKFGVSEFSLPLAPLEYLDDIDGVRVEKDYEGCLRDEQYPLQITIRCFFSLKDVEYLFLDKSFYAKYVASKIERKARSRFANCARDTLRIPMFVTIGGVERVVSLKLIDCSAMQGVGSLNTYASNVGINLEQKEIFSKSEKGRMGEMLMTRPKDFLTYAMGDVMTSEGLPLLTEIEARTRLFYCEVAKAVNVKLEPSEVSLSVGATVATILTKWLKQETGFSALWEDDMARGDDKKGLSWLTGIKNGSPKGIKVLGQLRRSKNMSTYGAMVDGGRATKAVEGTVHMGALVDEDISGCYGNGLKAQSFAVGTPSNFIGTPSKPVSLGKWMKKYKKYLVDGLWVLRVSTSKPLSFRQDILLSKIENQFVLWENGRQGEDSKVYDASMVLTKREVNHAALTSDLWQVINTVATRSELKELKDNLIVDSALFYAACNRVESLSEDIFDPSIEREGKTTQNGFVSGTPSEKWMEVNLSNFISPLLAMRKKYKKGTPLNTFLKLVINTTYGVIASAYFDTNNKGVSSVVVGNNITARARALAYLMEKGLGTKQSITDGGVYDINSVIHWRRMGINAASNVYWDISNDGSTNTYYTRKPLLGYEVDITSENLPNLADTDKAAWKHLQTQFPGIDVLADNSPFSFESKQWVSRLEMRNKTDYRLTDEKGRTKTALRGLPKHYQNTLGNDIFDAIADGEALGVTVDKMMPVSPKEWISGRFPNNMPHDFVTVPTRLFSHTPLGCSFDTYDDYLKAVREYDKIKNSGGDDQFIANILKTTYFG